MERHRIVRTIHALFGVLAVAADAQAQVAPPTNGPRHAEPSWHALAHARVTLEPGRVVEDATIVLKDGVIISVTEKGEPPVGARVWDLTGLNVYPGLVEPFLPVDAPRPDRASPGVHWNPRITPDRSALDGPGVPADVRKKLRGLGYAAAVIVPRDGLLRGSAAVVSLAEPADPSDNPQPAVLARDVFHCAGFDLGGFGDDAYPNSKMGAIAAIRQAVIDADWVAAVCSASAQDPQAPRPPATSALLPLTQKRPWLFEAAEPLDIWRFTKIAAEFRPGTRIVGVGVGSEYQCIDALRACGAELIVPPAYPKRPRVQTEADREATPLRDLAAWEQAPTNLRRLASAGLFVCITSSRMPRDADFMANLRDAVKAGLSEDAALAMLTTAPAKLVGMERTLGRIAPGASANLVVIKGGFFDTKREVRDVWVDGRRHEVNAAPAAAAVALAGMWDATIALAEPVTRTLSISEKVELSIEQPPPAQPGDAEAKEPSTGSRLPSPVKAKHAALSENRLDFAAPASALGCGADGTATVSAVLDVDTLRGTITMPDGSRAVFTATRKPPEPKTDAKTPEADTPKQPPPERIERPFGSFGLIEPPKAASVLIRNATIWTSGPAGVIRGGAVHIAGGKVRAVGAMPLTPDPRYPVEMEIDAQGRHVTPGIIDCHSHTGVSGSVNEGTQSCTAEVRIFDVIDPDDVNWYRQLAGGVTAVNQLHGSANAIGGQNSVVKLRWGCATPDDMRLVGAMPGIKFALGENVKQSNWGDRYTTRYPQTRMGVETYIRDRFIAAREYDAQRTARAGDPTVRRDLELEALAEILRGERLIHCHSYRQDEILMLCRVADEFGFTIGTFQHVLEGYKVAEAIKKSAIGGSTFSDWWAYKWEVYDAIPYNGAIMASIGIPVSFNSDSDELARRMNAEAGKAVKYGRVPPEEALKFVTINPAKQLRIDAMTGSLEVGKDADLAVWSGDPLSPTSRCERTYVDGVERFSLEQDAAARARIAAERNRIIQKILADPSAKEDARARDDGSGPGTDRPPGRRRREESQAPPYADLTSGRGAHLVPVGGDDEETARAIGEFRRARIQSWFEYLFRNGVDPSVNRPGVCGCEF